MFNAYLHRPQVTLAFISRTLDKYPWNLEEVLHSRKPGYTDFVIQHADRIQALPRDKYSKILTLIPFDDISKIPEVLNLGWPVILRTPGLVDRVCNNTGITFDFIWANAAMFTKSQWWSICNKYKDPAQLWRHALRYGQLHLLRLEGLCENPNAPESLVRKLITYRVGYINSLNKSIGFIRRYKSRRHYMRYWEKHPEADLDMIQVPGYADQRTFAEPRFRLLDMVQSPKLTVSARSCSYNPNTTVEFVCLNWDMNWSEWVVFARQPLDIAIDLLQMYPIFRSVWLGGHPELTVEVFLRFRKTIYLGAYIGLSC